MASNIPLPWQLFRRKFKQNKSIIECFEKLIMDQIEKEFDGSDDEFAITIKDEDSKFKSLKGFVVELFKDNKWKLFNIEYKNYHLPDASVKLTVQPIVDTPDDQTSEEADL